MKLDTMQIIVKQLPDLMDRLNIPKQYQKDHGHLLGTANESTHNLEEVAKGDIELLVGETTANCQYKLIFTSDGVLKTILKPGEAYGALVWDSISIPPPKMTTRVTQASSKFALSFAKKLFKL